MQFFHGFDFSTLQLETLKVLVIIMLASVLYCFVVGEISRNNSQMDKLWSILPIAYTWVTMFMSNFNWRCVIIAVLVTFWGIRLTINFGLKGAYCLKFWAGEEDYRWKYLRSTKVFKNHKFLWSIFNLLFISFFQNAVVLLIAIPSVAVMESTAKLGVMDFAAIVVALGFLIYETIADVQQMKFQNTKWGMINSGKKLEELPDPYNLGFNTTGLWNRSRHPNYIGEQLFWVGIYLFVIASKIAFIDVTIIGVILLIAVFAGSSRLAENLSSGKYPEYKNYQEKVLKYLPIKKYK